MKIIENRKTPEPPPVESYTLILSPEELRYIRYLAELCADIRATAGATATARLHRLTKCVESVPWKPEVCFLEET